MATQGPLYPGTVTTLSSGTESANDWLTPGNISADDAAEAQITAPTFDSPDISFRLIAANLGFTIPADATSIDGITVEIDRRVFAGTAQDFRVQLQDASATLVGTNKASASAWPGTLTIATYGGAADTWTASPTPAMVNDPDFGVVLSVSATAANTDIGVDFIRVTVDYTPNTSPTITPSTVAGVTTAPAATLLASAITAVSVVASVATVPAPTVIAGGGAALETGWDEWGRWYSTEVSETGRYPVLDYISEGGFRLFDLGIHATAVPATVAGVATVPSVTVSGTVEVDTPDVIATTTVDQPAIQIIPAPQHSRPDADQSIGTWTTDTGATTNLWDALNEVTASDADYVKSAVNPTNNEVIFTLTNIEDPLSSTGHEVRYRYRKTG